DSVQFHNASIIMKNLTIAGFGLDNWLGSVSADVKQQMVDELISSLGMPNFKLAVAAKYDLQQVKEAFMAVKTGALNGKALFWNG
ncbi:MAG: hypothetical protein LPK14_03235, partial [Hymenobacteraceae bacterium]|nr:hypothetical protein [Hymenobacteraceae bacterium]